jgi:hypothetical protein
VTKADETSLERSARIAERAVGAERVEKRCIIAVLILGFLQTFNARFQLGPDGISYLDVGDLWLKGDFSNAVNAYWNPVYCILLSAACKMVDPIHEPFVAHMVNFALLAVNLWLFKRLLRAIRIFRETHGDALSGDDDLFTGLAYLLFAWTHLALIELENLSPDLLVMSCVIGRRHCCLECCNEKMRAVRQDSARFWRSGI